MANRGVNMVETEEEEIMTEEEIHQIEVNSVVSEEMSMSIEEDPVRSEPLFAQHAVDKKRSIHVPISMQGIEATALIDCDATDNFNRSFKSIIHAQERLKSRTTQGAKDMQAGGGDDTGYPLIPE